MGPLELLWHLPGRSWRWVRSRRWRTVAACVLMLLSLRLVVYLVERDMAQKVSGPPVAQWEAMRPRAWNRAPALINKRSLGVGPIAYSLPEKPFIDQAKAPCLTKEDEVEINGGCWMELARRPPCREKQAEYRGKCYLPVSASSRREPQSLQR